MAKEYQFTTTGLTIFGLSVYRTTSMSSPQLHRETRRARLLLKCLLICISAVLTAMQPATAADPLGATLHKDGTTTFRVVWAPFVDDVALKINEDAPVPPKQ